MFSLIGRVWEFMAVSFLSGVGIAMWADRPNRKKGDKEW